MGWLPLLRSYAALDAHVLLQLFRHVTATPRHANDGTSPGKSWTRWCRTFHYYRPGSIRPEGPVPEALVRELAASGVAVPATATHLQAPHPLMSMSDAVSFLTR